MRIASPTFTLLSLLAAAALVLGSGWRLAMRSEERHLPPDRAALRKSAAELQRELLRLETLFQQNLRGLAEETAEAGDASLREKCDVFYGVVQFSRLKRNTPERDRHLPVHPGPDAAALPVPALAGATPPPPGDRTIVLPPEDTSPAGDAPDFGWFIPAGSPFWVVWKRLDDDEVDAFLIDRREIIARVDLSLRRWLAKPSPFSAAKGLFQIETPEGTSLAGLAEAPAGRDPDMVLPLVCRFGDWQIVAWDRITPHTFYDPATLALSSAIAAVLAILGSILFFQQRRAARLAEQRVSFVNRVSHELGTPLTNILLNLDLIEDDHAPLPDAVRHRLRLVSQEAQRLSRLVCNVLTFSRQERNQLKLSPTPLVPDEIVESVLQQFQPALERRGISTRWNGDAKQRIAMDGDAFAQI
ncbi:MAG: kdpD, partial [Akkermansiaceae bacterium]|nr:kdpD [Akkermansiaceae bacterium]